MPEGIYNQAAAIIKQVPLDKASKLLLVDLVVRMDRQRLADLLSLLEDYIQDSSQSDRRLRAQLKKIKNDFDQKQQNLNQQIDQALGAIDAELENAEQEGKIEETRKKISSS